MEQREYRTFLTEADPLALLEAGLRRYQEEALGERILFCGDVVSLLGLLHRHADADVKRKRGYVDIVEKRVRRQDRQAYPFSEDPVAYLDRHGRLRDWQREQMERDAAGAVALRGDAG